MLSNINISILNLKEFTERMNHMHKDHVVTTKRYKINIIVGKNKRVIVYISGDIRIWWKSDGKWSY